MDEAIYVLTQKLKKVNEELFVALYELEKLNKDACRYKQYCKNLRIQRNQLQAAIDMLNKNEKSIDNKE